MGGARKLPFPSQQYFWPPERWTAPLPRDSRGEAVFSPTRCWAGSALTEEGDPGGGRRAAGVLLTRRMRGTLSYLRPVPLMALPRAEFLSSMNSSRFVFCCSLFRFFPPTGV